MFGWMVCRDVVRPCRVLVQRNDTCCLAREGGTRSPSQATGIIIQDSHLAHNKDLAK